MGRLALFAALLAGAASVAGCSFIGWHAGPATVVDRGVYCGTTSQHSAVHYFANEAEFASWIDYRGIREFKPKTARDDGVIVVEMGQRMTGGYEINLLPDQTHVEDDILYLGVSWTAPPHYAAISQAMTSPCLVIKPPQGQYSQVVVVDQLDNIRAKADVH